MSESVLLYYFGAIYIYKEKKNRMENIKKAIFLIYKEENSFFLI